MSAFSGWRNVLRRWLAKNSVDESMSGSKSGTILSSSGLEVRSVGCFELLSLSFILSSSKLILNLVSSHDFLNDPFRHAAGGLQLRLRAAPSLEFDSGIRSVESRGDSQPRQEGCFQTAIPANTGT